MEKIEKDSIALTNDQKRIFRNLVSTLKKCQESGITLMVDSEQGDLFAYNSRNGITVTSAWWNDKEEEGVPLEELVKDHYIDSGIDAWACFSDSTFILKQKEK